jgi:hypothetical protein
MSEESDGDNHDEEQERPSKMRRTSEERDVDATNPHDDWNRQRTALDKLAHVQPPSQAQDATFTVAVDKGKGKEMDVEAEAEPLHEELRDELTCAMCAGLFVDVSRCDIIGVTSQLILYIEIPPGRHLVTLRTCVLRQLCCVVA